MNSNRSVRSILIISLLLGSFAPAGVRDADTWGARGAAPAAFASSTQEIRIEGSAAFLEGKFGNVGLNELGELVMGFQASRAVPVDDVGYILAAAQIRDRTLYGGGLPASIVTVDGKSAVVRAKFQSDVAVSALSTDGRHLFAASLPSAAIYKVDDRGNTTPFTDFSTGAAAPNYVWAMSVHRGCLYVALGGHFPSVYKIDLKTAKKELLYQVEGKARNVTALSVTEDAVFFGDDIGRVFRLSHDSSERPAVLYSFSDAEIKSIAPFDKGMAIAVNSRRFVPPPPPAQPPSKDQVKTPEGQAADEGGELGLGSDLKKAIEAVASAVDGKLRETSQNNPPPLPEPVDAKPVPPPPPAARPESPGAQSLSIPPAFQDPFGKGEGNLFWMTLDGSAVHRLWFSQSSIVLSILPDGDFVWTATSNPARLYRIGRDGSERLFYESSSKDLSVITFSGKTLQAAASNPAVLIDLKPAETGEYSSKIFDAGFPCRIGRPEVVGSGAENSEISVRSGATSDIDSGWSAFRSLSGSFPQVAGRFFQVKLKLKSDVASIRRIRVPYRVQNLYPRLINMSAEVVRSQDGSPDGRDVRFQWDAVNLDNDVLQYQISYQPPGGKKFIPMFKPADQPKNVKTFSFPSDQFTDGTYRFRLDVTDEPSNGNPAAMTHQAEFPLVLLDRTPPLVELKQDDRQIRWQAADAASRITRAEYRLDGGPWLTLLPEDALFDASAESGRMDLANLSDAAVIDVRCYDERENTRIYSLILK